MLIDKTPDQWALQDFDLRLPIKTRFAREKVHVNQAVFAAVLNQPCDRSEQGSR